jgi:hypothetical protein
MRYWYIFPLLMILCIIPASASTAQLLWTKTIGDPVTAVDTSSTGTLIFAGLSNGTIFAYDPTGNISWVNATNTTATNKAIKKIVSDQYGDIVWISQANQSGYISSTGTVAGVTPATLTNFSDVSISGNGYYYITSELSPPKIAVRYPNGSIVAQNTSYGTVTGWTKLGYSPDNAWFVTANISDNRLFFWNISSWNGWEQFNPEHVSTKNQSLLFLDSFPYRANFSLTSTKNVSIIFYNTSNVTSISKVNESFYFYNRALTGNYFLWQPYGTYPNASNASSMNQSQYLITSKISGNNYYIKLRSGTTNYSIYYGNFSYTSSIGTWYTNGTNIVDVVYTGTTSWTSPEFLSSVNLTLMGGGGGGSSGNCSYGNGTGGGASTPTTYQNVGVIPLHSYTVSVGLGGDGGAYGYGCAPDGNAGANGGTTSFNGTQTGTGGTGATTWANHTVNGSNGSVNYTSIHAANGYNLWDMGGFSYGGYGLGAGGGGGAYGWDAGMYGPKAFSPGGNGTGGGIYINYTYYGFFTPTTSYIFAQESSTNVGLTLNQSSSKELAGTILGLSVPSTGGIVSIVTDQIFYQQYAGSTGLGLLYCATLSGGTPAVYAGVPHDVQASNSGTASIAAQGAYLNVYDSGGIAKASSLTGGTVNSVDTAMSSGTFAIAGGTDGKVYIISREGSSSWYSYFSGVVDTNINAVSITWDSVYAAAGRQGGTLELYYMNANNSVNVLPTSSYVDAHVHVYKDASAYANASVTVYSSATGVSSWTPLTTGYTDSTGQYHLTTTTGIYYKFVVGTTESIWLSNSASTTININTLSASNPYSWSATYNSTTDNITVMYTDSTPVNNVTFVVKDLHTNIIVGSQSFYSVGSVIYLCHGNNGNGTGSYQIAMIDNRVGSAVVRDQKIVGSSKLYEIPIDVDQNMKYALALFVLMIVGGIFTAINARRGGFVVVVIAAAFMIFGFLPWTIVGAVMIAALFAVMALLSAGSRKGD